MQHRPRKKPACGRRTVAFVALVCCVGLLSLAWRPSAPRLHSAHPEPEVVDYSPRSVGGGGSREIQLATHPDPIQEFRRRSGGDETNGGQIITVLALSAEGAHAAAKGALLTELLADIDADVVACHDGLATVSGVDIGAAVDAALPQHQRVSRVASAAVGVWVRTTALKAAGTDMAELMAHGVVKVNDFQFSP